MHTVAEWDKFHRQGVAMTCVTTYCPLADKMYRLRGLMDHTFGFGDGRQLIKTAANATNAHIRFERLPGMTRKAVQLCSELGHLLLNFRAYSAGTHVKEAWRNDGH